MDSKDTYSILNQEEFLSISNENSNSNSNSNLNNNFKEIEMKNFVDNENSDIINSFSNLPQDNPVNNSDEIKPNKFTFKKISFDIIIPLVYNLLSFTFYILSLEGCHKPQHECIPLLSTIFLVRIVIFGVLSSLMVAIEVYLILFKKFKFYHFFYVPIFFLIMYYYDHGTRLDYHGMYNIIAIIFTFVVFIIFIGLAILIFFSITRKKLLPLILIVSIIFFIIINIALFFNSLKDSCSPWMNGLNSTVVDNSPDFECQIEVPKKCYINTINSFFDFSRFVKSCSPDYDHEEDHKHFLRYLKVDENLKSKSSLNHFGYPITVNNPLYNKNNPKEYYSIAPYVLKNMILMDLYNNPEKKYYNESYLKPEVEIIYDEKTKKRKIEINLIKNETLSKERKKIEKNPKNNQPSIFNNILIIYIDCISRQHFLRIMKKTSSFIEQFMKYNNNLGFNSYEFMKFQSFCHWTVPNVLPMFYSSYINSNQVHILKYLKENGYVTGQTHNMCSKESFEIETEHILGARIELDEFDHENIAMFCDPVYEEYDHPTPIASGPYGMLRRCLSGKETFEYLFDYGRQFWDKYKDNKRYLRLIFQDAHEFTGQVVKYLDDALYNFLNELYSKKELDDTAIFFISDHGNSYFYYYYYYVLNSDDSLIERGHASLYIILPNSKTKNNKTEEYFNNIRIRQQAYVTPFDIHDTLLHICFGDNLSVNSELYSHYGNSLLSNFEYKSRKCKQYKNHFASPELCICRNGYD